VGAALGESGLSLPQALAIVRVLEPAEPRADLDELTWAEGALVDAAVAEEWPLGPELLTQQGRLHAAILDPDGILPDAERQRALRSASIHQRRDGMWRTEIISPAEEGSAVKALLDAFTGPRVEVRFRDDIDPAAAGAHEGSDGSGPHGHDGHRGDARGGDGYDDRDGRASGGDGETSAMEADDERTLEQKRHDVQVGILREAAGKHAPRAGGEPPVLVLSGTIAAYQAYLQGLRHSAGYLTVEHTGDLLPMASVDRLVCDGDVQLSIADERHHTLVLGRTERLSRAHSDVRSRAATRAARSSGAGPRRRGARRTTLSPGRPAAPRTSTTGSCCARTTITRCTPAGCASSPPAAGRADGASSPSSPRRASPAWSRCRSAPPPKPAHR
jgi:hypothetical protein